MKALGLLWRRRWREVVGATLVCSAGLICLDPLRPKSLDYLFALRGSISPDSNHFPHEVAVVYLDNGTPGDWKPYTDLLTRLSLSETNSPEAVVFDFFFTQEGTNHTFPEFSNAVKNAATRTKVVFVSKAVVTGSEGIPIKAEGLLGGISDLAAQLYPSVSIGLANLPEDLDGGVRTYAYTNFLEREPLAFTVAQILTQSVEQATFHINYYGPAGTLTHYESADIIGASYAHPAYLTGKVLFIGAHSSDQHHTPFAHFAANLSSGVEIQATAYANLVHGNEIRGIAGLGEAFLVLMVGVACGASFARWTPRRGFLIAAGSAFLVAVVSFMFFKYANLFIPWMAIVVTQLSASFSVSVLPIKSAFISYRGLDMGTVQHMVEGLEARGIEVYFDLKDGGVGQLKDGLFPEVEKREIFILVVTPALLGLAREEHEANERDWVREEIARALSKGKRLLLVFVGGVERDVRDKRGELQKPYKAAHTDYSFALGSVLSGEFRTNYSVEHFDSSIEKIARELPLSLRRDWGRRPPAPSRRGSHGG